MTKKQYNWIWFIIAIMPIVIIIINQTTNGVNINASKILASMGFTVESTIETNGTYSLIFNYTANNSLENIIMNLMTKLMPNRPNNMFNQYIAYLIRLEIIKIALNVFLILPRICNGLTDKLTGGTKIE